MLHLGPVLGGVVHQEDPAVLHTEWLTTVNLHTGRRPARPGAGAETRDLTLPHQLVPVTTAEPASLEVEIILGF